MINLVKRCKHKGPQISISPIKCFVYLQLVTHNNVYADLQNVEINNYIGFLNTTVQYN